MSMKMMLIHNTNIDYNNAIACIKESVNLPKEITLYDFQNDGKGIHEIIGKLMTARELINSCIENLNRANNSYCRIISLIEEIGGNEYDSE